MKRTLTFGLALTLLCIGLALASLSMTGCSTVADALDIRNPRYSIRDFRPRVNVALPLSASTIDVDFVLGVDNPNTVGLRLDRIDFDLLVSNNRLLSTSSRQDVRIPARGLGQIPLHARVGYNEIRSMWTEVADLIRGNRGNYEVRGTAYYDTPAGTLRFPVTVYSSR